MQLVDHAGLEPEVARELTRAVADLATLAEVLRWSLGLSPPGSIAEVVVQDEFTHDVVMTWTGGAYLAFDTT